MVSNLTLTIDTAANATAHIGICSWENPQTPVMTLLSGDVSTNAVGDVSLVGSIKLLPGWYAAMVAITGSGAPILSGHTAPVRLASDFSVSGDPTGTYTDYNTLGSPTGRAPSSIAFFEGGLSKMSDTIKLKDGTTPPTSLGHGEMAINETSRTLFVRTNRGPIDIPLDRMAIEPFDENGSSQVYVYRSTLTAERTELVGGGGGNARDDRTWHIFGNAPQATSTGNPLLRALFEINYPINIRTLRRFNGFCLVQVVWP